MSGLEKKPATLRTVAEQTGLSLSTVSLCLRGGKSVKESTRKRVIEAADQIGYVPNRAGVRLRTGRTNVLSLVLSADESALDFTRQLIQGISAGLSGSRFHLNVVPDMAREDQTSAVRYILESRAADGIIVTHTSARDPRVEMLLDADFPFVAHGRTAFRRSHPFHDFHGERFAQQAVHRMAARGRKKILLAAVDNGTTNYSNIVEGFQSAIQELGLQGSLVDHKTALNVLVDGKTLRYDGIICNNELTTLSLISGLANQELLVGRDFDVIAKRMTNILPMLYPVMDTVEENVFLAGQALAELLVERINGVDAKQLQSLQQPALSWQGP